MSVLLWLGKERVHIHERRSRHWSGRDLWAMGLVGLIRFGFLVDWESLGWCGLKQILGLSFRRRGSLVFCFLAEREIGERGSNRERASLEWEGGRSESEPEVERNLKERNVGSAMPSEAHSSWLAERLQPATPHPRALVVLDLLAPVAYAPPAVYASMHWWV